MGQTSSIINGWANYLVGLASEIELDRALFCSECPSAVEGTYEKLLPDFKLKKVKGMKCKECNCPLSTKIRSKKEKCPLNKW